MFEISDLLNLPKRVEVLNDFTFKHIIAEMPSVCIFGALWCADTQRMMMQALPAMIEKHGWPVRFCFVAIQQKSSDHDSCPDIKRIFGIEKYPSLAGFVGGKILDCGPIISEGVVELQLQDLEAISRLVLIT